MQFVIHNRYGLTLEQTEKICDSSQFGNIIRAATIGRWDQVTLMLIQEKIIEKWPS